MKRIILTLIVILGVLCQPCYAVDKKPSISELKKPEGKYVEHKVCLYINEKGTVPTYKYFYPMLDGETRKIESDTQIELNAPVDELQAISVKLYNDSLVFYGREHIRKEKELTVPVINSNQFCGNATLELKLQYINGNLENYNFYFEKEDNYSDIVLEDEPHINASGESDIVISFAIKNFSKLIYPEKICVMSSNGKNCASHKDEHTKNVYGRIIVPFEPDGLDRDYKVIIPARCIMLDNGLNNELIFEVKNEIEYVTVSNFVDSASPMPDQIKYIDGDKDVIAVTIKINDEFKVDDTKLLLFNHKPVDYIAEATYNGTILKFNADVMTGKRYNVEFGEGLIVGKNGEINGAKENYYFSVVNVNSIDLPEKVIFIDLPINHWAYDYITQLALEGACESFSVNIEIQGLL